MEKVDYFLGICSLSAVENVLFFFFLWCLLVELLVLKLRRLTLSAVMTAIIIVVGILYSGTKFDSLKLNSF